MSIAKFICSGVTCSGEEDWGNFLLAKVLISSKDGFSLQERNESNAMIKKNF